MDIGLIRVTEKGAGFRGGTVYDNHVIEGIKSKFNIELKELYIKNNSSKLLRIFGLGWDLLRQKNRRDIWIRDFKSTITIPYDRTEGKNISLFYHHDPSVFNIENKLIYYILIKMYYRSLKNVDIVVTISDYWKEHFLNMGYSNIKKIYTAFDMDEFNFMPGEINEFKTKYGFNKEKPIIYLGNCQEAKGVVEAYRELKDLDAFLITSGNKEVDIPAINLDLNYREYLLLLKSSDVVVTMSKFKEGWCRTAHEAMLCKTPVVGSGFGGMAELLNGGGQIVCNNFVELKEKVEYALEHQELGENGYKYASKKQFSKEYFNNEWIELIKSLGS